MLSLVGGRHVFVHYRVPGLDLAQHGYLAAAGHPILHRFETPRSLPVRAMCDGGGLRPGISGQTEAGKDFPFPAILPAWPGLPFSQIISSRLDETKLQVISVRNMIATHATSPAARMEPESSIACPSSSTLRIDGVV